MVMGRKLATVVGKRLRKGRAAVEEVVVEIETGALGSSELEETSESGQIVLI